MNIATYNLQEAMKLIQRWERLKHLDIVLEDFRCDSTYERKEQVIFLVKDYFRYSAQNKVILQKNHSKSIKKRLRTIIDLSIIRFVYHQTMPVEMIVDSAVELVKTLHNKYEAGFVNQLLRKISSIRQVTIESTADLFPPLLKKHWCNIYSKENIQKLVKVISQIPLSYISTQETVDDASLGEPLEFEWAKGYLFYPIIDFSNWKKSVHFTKFYIQDPATFLSVGLLSAQKGEYIGDLCAAPGGKARLISQQLGVDGKLICKELSESRIKRLKENLANFKNVEIVLGDCMKMENYKFDAILLDVPCSNTGVFRRKVDAMWSFSLQKIDQLVQLQQDILWHSVSLVKEGGRIIYSTCSIDEQENQQQIKNFLHQFPQFNLVEEILLMPSSSHDGAYAAILELIEL